ncbi:uncharacterized protein Triagg1_1703 [Trichoderma aggressivum f. europaeum]|uniref:HNH nuclease domain-containing protein n=1 Tax=Trichoderma aggressivum f. europaeum TaxID=173218 RepID=A0AAE1M2M0_9HYPO|nr:hypothetical protein Triagg1_1703 [Trichoderma aggressivum f. europaeum]
MTGRGKNRSRKAQRKEEQQRKEQQRNESEEAQGHAGPSQVPQLAVPVTPSPRKPTSEDASPPKRRLQVADTPTPHGTGHIQKDEDAAKILALTGIRHKMSREVEQQVQEVIGDNRNRHGKQHSISQLSNLTIGVTQSPDKQQMIQKGRQTAESIIEGRLQSKKKYLAQAEQLVTILYKAWHNGGLDVTKDKYDSQLEQLERFITALRGDVVVIQTSRHELGGRLMDNMIWEQDLQNTDWAYLDLLISRYKTPEGAKLSLFAPRDADAQARFRKRVMNAYDAVHKDSEWCVIAGRFFGPRDIKAAHIVGYNVGEPSARHLFGPPSDNNGHLMSDKNGIPMYDLYEKAFDDARLVIIPEVQPDGNPRKGCWKVYCLDDPDTHEESTQVPVGRELHGRSLKFRNDFRPSARYLYFAFCINILRRQRHKVPGWWRDVFLEGPGKVWATPGTYLRTSTLRRLAHQIGHMTEEEVVEFAGPADADEEEEEDVEMLDAQADLVLAAYLDQGSPTPATHKGQRLPRDERYD